MNLGFSQKLAGGKATHFVAKIWAGFIGQDNWGSYLEWIWENQIIISNIDDKYLSETIKPKLHTIRDDKTNRWTAGKLIHFIINNRSANRLQFAPVIPVVSTQVISIYPKPSVRKVVVDGRYLTKEEIETLAFNDGFESVDGFFAYFSTNCTLKLIHWTNLKY